MPVGCGMFYLDVVYSVQCTRHIIAMGLLSPKCRLPRMIVCELFLVSLGENMCICIKDVPKRINSGPVDIIRTVYYIHGAELMKLIFAVLYV